MPIILGKYFAGAKPEKKASLMRAVAALGHDARAIMPSDMQIEVQKVAGSGDGTPHLAMVDWAERSESKAILGQTTSAEAKATGLGSGIAQAQAEVRDDIRNADARQIAATITRDLIYPLIALNRGGIDGLRRSPRIRFDTGEAEDLAAYAEALPKQLNDPGLARLRPYWQYVHADGVAHPRPLHLAWHGLTLPRAHYFWRTHFPPNGWFCHCRVKAVGQREYDAAVNNGRGPDAAPAEGDTAGIDPGWAYAPGANRMTPLAGMVEKKLFNLEAPIGAAMMQALRPTLLAEQARAFAAFVDRTLADPKPAGRGMAVGALPPSWIAAASLAGVAPATADITVRDRDIWHTFRDNKQGKLDIAWYQALPHHLLSPTAVVLDKTHPNEPAFLLFYDGGADGKKRVIRVNYRIKKVGLGNIVETGKVVDLDDVRPMIGHGYDLVEGSL